MPRSEGSKTPDVAAPLLNNGENGGESAQTKLQRVQIALNCMRGILAAPVRFAKKYPNTALFSAFVCLTATQEMILQGVFGNGMKKSTAVVLGNEHVGATTASLATVFGARAIYNKVQELRGKTESTEAMRFSPDA